MDKILNSSSTKSQLDQFLDSTTADLGGITAVEYWPLQPAQILAYYDASFLLDFYLRIEELKKQKIDTKEIAKLFHNSSVIVDFLVNFACVGFKVLHNHDIYKFDFSAREQFFEEMFEIIKVKRQGKFIEEEKKEYLNKKQFQELLDQGFIRVNDRNRAAFNKLKATMFGLNWAFFYDLFAVFGESSHGPYLVDYRGEKLMMLAREYYNLKELPFWQASDRSPAANLKIFTLFKPFELRMGALTSRPKTTVNLGREMKYILVLVDDKKLTDLGDIKALNQAFSQVAIRQHQDVEALKDLEKIDRAIAMTYYAHRELFGEGWKAGYEKTRKNLDEFGGRFLKAGAKTPSERTKQELRKVFDPRNNHF